MTDDKILRFSDMGVCKPNQRLKHLSDYGGLIVVDKNIPVKRYYLSGTQMLNMARVYESEGQYENAFVLYIKFMVLFLEKIQSHPEYNSVPANMKQLTQSKLKEALCISEKLKVSLLNKYQKEYDTFILNKQKEEEQRKQEKHVATNCETNNEQLNQQTNDGAFKQNSLLYPNDFPDLKTGKKFGLPESSSFSSSSSFSTDGLLITAFVDNLKEVIVPKLLSSKFLQAVSKNTSKNVETCGILAGKLSNFKLTITHVVLPKQSGTSDSCSTMNEEELFDFQDKNNLITVGWIHTHPTQTAFLSSVDLHTQCSYQKLIPEAIAIVCAPKFDTTEIFCLTPNYGLDYIANCNLQGFHPHHNDPPIFQNANHVVLQDSLDVEIKDLRNS